MTIAKCNKCGGTALGKTFEEASGKINHAVGLSRGIKCGDNYNMVCQVDESPKPVESTPKVVAQTPSETVPKQSDTKTKKSEKPKSEKKPRRE